MTAAAFAILREPVAFEGFDEDQVTELLAPYESLANAIIKSLKPYFDAETYELIENNLILHYFIVSGAGITDTSTPQGFLVDKYGVEAKAADFIVNSVSNSGSSVSVQDFSSLSNSKFLLQDLIRTPYGQYVYMLLETLQGIAIVLL